LNRAAPIPAPGKGGDRKHPTIAVNTRGEVLLVWAEGTGWQKGGALAWQLFDAKDRPTAVRGRVPAGVPVWGLATAAARADGSFLLVY
jgi:hypothetical protein